MDSDSAHVQQALAGDSASFDELVKKYLPDVYRYLLWLTHDGETGGFQGRSGQNGQWQSDGGRVFGEVQSVNDGRITVQTQNGGSQIVLFNDSTSYQRTVDGTVDDVATGTRVLVTGQQNPDGSTTASAIQILPEGADFPFGGRQHDGQGNQTGSQ